MRDFTVTSRDIPRPSVNFDDLPPCRPGSAFWNQIETSKEKNHYTTIHFRTANSSFFLAAPRDASPCFLRQPSDSSQRAARRRRSPRRGRGLSPIIFPYYQHLKPNLKGRPGRSGGERGPLLLCRAADSTAAPSPAARPLRAGPAPGRPTGPHPGPQTLTESPRPPIAWVAFQLRSRTARSGARLLRP